MNWDAIGAIGEIASALAVFITLLFLAIQIRQSNRVNAENTRILRAEMKHRSNDSITHWCEVLIADSELSRIWDLGNADAELSEMEQTQYYRIARNYLGLHATSYYDYEAIHDDYAKQRMTDFAAQELAANPGLKKVWERLENTPFTNYADFYNTVNARLAESGV